MKWVGIAYAENGVSEVVGPKGSNKRIEEYQQTTPLTGQNDDIPWCSSFVNWVLLKSKIPGTGSAWARSFLKWGMPCDYRYGSVVVFSRGTNSGHVGFAVGKRPGFIKVLGGNQDNRVSEKWYPLWRLLGYRWHVEFDKIIKERVEG